MAVFKRQQVAAYAAGQQHRFWQYAMLFLRQQGVAGSGYVTEQYLDAIARLVPGLNYSTWLRGRSDPALIKQVTSDDSTATHLGIAGTPAIVFQGPRGKAQPPTAGPSYKELARELKSVS
jgi:protein-disulfide isomerase